MITRVILAVALAIGLLPVSGQAQEAEIDLEEIQKYQFLSCDFDGVIEMFVVLQNPEDGDYKIVSHPQFDIISQEETLTLASDGVVYQFRDDSAVRIENASPAMGQCQILTGPIYEALVDLADATRLKIGGSLSTDLAKLREALSQERERATEAKRLAEERQVLLWGAEKERDEAAKSAESHKKLTSLLERQVAALRSQMNSLNDLLLSCRQSDERNLSELEVLSTEMNTAFGRLASCQRINKKKEAELEELIQALKTAGEQ